MRFQYKQICELPFMLNVQSGVYEVFFENKIITLSINNDFYAASKQGSTTALIAMIGPEDSVSEFVATNPSFALTKLRTVVSRDTFLRSPFFPMVAEDTIVDFLYSKLLSKQPHLEHSRDEAKFIFSSFSLVEQYQWAIKASAMKFARKKFPPEQGYDFLRQVNTVIQRYCTEYNDHFAQEVSLHDVCQTTCGGIVQIIYADEQLINNATLVGKIPPIFRTSWFNHEEQSGKSFKDILKNDTPIDQVKMLLVRSRSLLEKGAYRSSIIESSAALETEVSNVIRMSLAKKGWLQSDIDSHLRKNQKFDDRAKKLLTESVGFTLAEVDNSLWSKTKMYRDELRHKIAHSDTEPTLKDAEAAVNTFDEMISKFRVKISS
ncbi:hypothetical protein V1481_01600 [Aeromonas enteropelogenes]|uniref:hypothetical protein n=1 Tax=Aeromonas enteropelogenes TaxID=29489 RepID=UPI0031354736